MNIDTNIYDNQAEAANEAFEKFERGGKTVALIGAMQVGKTGAIAKLMSRFLEAIPRSKVLLLTMLNDKHLHEQNGERLDAMLAAQASPTNTLSDILNTDDRAKRFKTAFIPCLKKSKIKVLEDFCKKDNVPILVVIDEAHMGISNAGQLIAFLKNIGVSEIEDDSVKWHNRNLHICFCSATPFPIQNFIRDKYKDSSLKNDWNEVIIEPSSKYRGCRNFIETQRVKPFIEYFNEKKTD